MATAEKVKAPKIIQPGTVEMELMLQAGYPDMTVVKAKQIIKERTENPMLWPYSELQRAEAFLAAYNGKAQVISTRKGWKRKK